MTLYDTNFWDAIDSARAELGGSYHYDHETGTEYNFPAKDTKKYSKAYDYCFATMNTFINLSDTIEEIKLIKAQVQHSQDFSLQNTQFSTDFILKFSYKNWIIRINIIAEQLISLTNDVYRLRLSDKDLINKIFEHERVKNDKPLYFGLLNLIDFLHDKILRNVNSKSFKKARNEIVHNANFSHDIINNLSFQLFEYKYGLSDKKDSEDIYLEEGQTSEKIKNEILDFTAKFLEKYNALYSLFADEFSSNFKKIMQSVDNG
ncbi:MAG: hypothetical protein E6Q39_02155 [Crocinitomicaceae bacterium]|nr:MAG: hypothetical protein E6Q39_02155 [Crocinitomicaceae bacterium]